MPLPAFGKYEVAATTQVNGKTQEFCSDSFTYLPILRLIAVLLSIFALMLPVVLRRSAIANKQSWWLVIPVLLALLVFAFAPDHNRLGYLILAESPSQMISLSLFLWIVCSFSKRRRAVSALVILLISAGVLLAIAAGTYGMSFLRYDIHIWNLVSVALLWALPVILTMFALVPRFTRLRLAVLLTFFWALSVTGQIYYSCSVWGMPLILKFVLPIILSPLPGLLGLLLYAALNSWCREGLIRAFGMKVRDQTPSDMSNPV